MGQETAEIAVGLEVDDGSTIKKLLDTKIQTMKAKAENGDEAHNALSSAVETQAIAFEWIINHMVASFKELRMGPARTAKLVAEAVRQAVQEHEEGCAKRELRTMSPKTRVPDPITKDTPWKIIVARVAMKAPWPTALTVCWCASLFVVAKVTGIL
jgi:hypothetical protein